MSARSLLPLAWVPLEHALQERRPVRLTYHGHRRLISPHALGWSRGRLVLLGYQSDEKDCTEPSPADTNKAWRCMFVDEIEHVVPSEDTAAWQSADNYDPKHPFSAIDAVIVAVESSGDGA
jgi:hypothetical protein